MRGEGDGLRFELPPDSAPSRRPLGLDGDRVLAQGAVRDAVPDVQNDLLAGIEARLTKEVIGLIGALQQFAARAQAIRIEIPDDAQFCKNVSLALSLLSLQFAVALGKGLDQPLLSRRWRRVFAQGRSEP